MAKHSPYARREASAQTPPAPSLDVNELEDDSNPARVANVPAATPRRLTFLARLMPFFAGPGQQAAFAIHLFVLVMVGSALFAPYVGNRRHTGFTALVILGVLELVAMPLSLYLAARTMPPALRTLGIIRRGRLCRGHVVEASTEGLKARQHHFTVAFRAHNGHEGNVRFQRVAKLEDARTYLAEHGIEEGNVPVCYDAANPAKAATHLSIGIEFDRDGVGRVATGTFAARLVFPGLVIVLVITFVAVALARLSAH